MCLLIDLILGCIEVKRDQFDFNLNLDIMLIVKINGEKEGSLKTTKGPDDF